MKRLIKSLILILLIAQIITGSFSGVSAQSLLSESIVVDTVVTQSNSLQESQAVSKEKEEQGQDTHTDKPQEESVGTKAEEAVGETYTSGYYEYTVYGSEATITKYTGSASSVSIPSSLGGYTVKMIGNGAFKDCTSLTSVSIPSTVTAIEGSIEDGAFQNCTLLTSITIPNSVKTIGFYAFCGCKNLSKVTIGSSVETIAPHAFRDCEKLTSIVIPNSVKKLGYSSFANCKLLETANIGGGIGYVNTTYDASSAFEGCTALVSVTISNGTTIVGSSMFMNCTSLTRIDIPESVTQIGSVKQNDSDLKDSYVFYNHSPSLVIYGKYGSFAENFANANGINFNQSSIPSVNNLTDTYIIEQVKKYTSENITDDLQFNAIMNANISGETRLYLLNELFKNNGFTDVKSGIEYLRDTSTYRNDYKFLTNDEIFCANNFYDWLYSPSGTIPRGLLYTDGWIFNGELSAYLDITTYTDKDFPNVKKNKKFLKDFLEQDTQEAVVLKEAKTVGSYFEKLIKLNNIEYVDSIKELHQKINHAKSLNEIERYQNQLAALVSAKVNSNYSNKIYLDGDRFSEALGYSVSVIEFAGATVDNIIQMVNLDKEIAKYQYYKKFLLGIYNCSDISADMRMAAYLLLDDINNGYYNHIVSIIGSCIKLEKDILITDFDIWSTVFGTGGEVIGEAISTIKLAAFIDNIIVDTGDFVNQVAYTQGYAEVSKLYSLKLKQDKTAFVASPTKENAWQFFEDYTMLWSLRYKGEEQYLKMNKVKMFIFGEVKTSDYTIKSDVVNDNLSMLNQKKFEFAENYTIPEGVMYSSKAVINCPVNIYVYSQSGKLVATLNDGVESDITNEYGRFAVMKQSYSGEYAKIVALKNSDDVIIKSVAHSQGLVDYSFASSNGGKVKTFTINNVSVNNGTVIKTSNNVQTYAIDYEGNGTYEIESQLQEKSSEYVAVSAINSNLSKVSLIVGEEKLLTISITPNNATNPFVAWFTDKEDIVSISNGVVKALKPGTATVYAKSLDSIDVMISFEIEINSELGDVNLDGQVSISDATEIQKYLAEFIELSEIQKLNADTNGDGLISISDATEIQKYLAEYIDDFG